MSRPAESVLAEAEVLVSAGVKELLVVSQDTSADGVGLKYATGFHGAKPVRSHIQGLSEALGKLGVWVRFRLSPLWVDAAWPGHKRSRHIASSFRIPYSPVWITN